MNSSVAQVRYIMLIILLYVLNKRNLNKKEKGNILFV